MSHWEKLSWYQKSMCKDILYVILIILIGPPFLMILLYLIVEWVDFWLKLFGAK